MAKTGIEWTDNTVNVFTGCSEVSPACTFCYAKYMAHRLEGIAHSAKKYKGTTRRTEGGKVQWTGRINFSEEALMSIFKIAGKKKIFVNSMSDTFHEDVPFEWIDKLFAVMAMRKQHTFQILTKRTARMREYMESLRDRCSKIVFEISQLGGSFEDMCFAGEHIEQNGFLPNVWLGCTVENQATANERIPYLLATPAGVRFLSCEPLLEEIDLTKIFDSFHEGGLMSYIYPLKGYRYTTQSLNNTPIAKIDWVITGGESGNRKGIRPSHPDWFRSIRDQCAEAGVAYFHKQNGAYEMCDDERATEITNIGHVLTQYNRAIMQGLGYAIAESCFLTLYDTNGKESKTLCYERGVETPKLVLKVGDAGSLLDGIEHKEFPK
jgi:protein gp37